MDPQGTTRREEREIHLEVDGRTVAPLLLAATYPARLRGMLGRRHLPPALLLRPSNSVHGVGMLHTIEVAILDSDGTVLVTLVLKPFGLTRPRRGAASVLEAPRG